MQAQQPVPVRHPGDIDYYNYLAYRCHEKGDVEGAAKNFLLYLKEPARLGMTQAAQDSLYQADRLVYDQAAVNAMYLFFSVGDMDGVMETLPYGRRIKKGMSNVYITGMEACKEKGLEDLRMELLHEAVEKCSHNPQFLRMLVDHYTDRNQADLAAKEVERLIEKNGNNADTWFAKGVILFNEKKNAEARRCFSKALAIDAHHVQANVSMAATYMFDVQQERRMGRFPLVFMESSEQVNQKEYKKQLAEVQTYYFNAKLYLEVARFYDPEGHQLWGEQLLEVYKMLNMRKEYDSLKREMDETLTKTDFIFKGRMAGTVHA